MNTPISKKQESKKLPVWKKIGFAVVVNIVAAGLLYLPCEITYRLIYDIPIQISGNRTPEDSRQFDDLDTSPMDFESIHYYEIFRPSDNPVLYYEPKPGFSKGAVTINSHGFRDHEYPLKKPPGTTRIVVLGDSVIWGHGLVLEDTFPKQLEVLLNDRLDGNYEVLNFGVSGYSLQQEVEQYIARASQFDPDFSILGLCVNDHFYSSIEGDFFKNDDDAGLFSKSYFLNTLILTTSQILNRQFGVPQRYLERVVDVTGQMKRLREASSDTPWLVLMFPLLADVDNYQSHQDHQILTQPARDQGFTVRDLLEDYQRVSTRPLGVDHIHPNRFGNGIAAEAAYNSLVSSGMVSAKQQASATVQD